MIRISVVFMFALMWVTTISAQKVPVILTAGQSNADGRVRKIKIKQKVSGCFRTDEGADDFAKLHSIAETAMKNGNSKFSAILAVVRQ